jgi:hypothetical protein
MVGGLMISSIGSGQIISRIGRYKIFMQVGIVLATVMVALLSTLTPETGYGYEAVIIALLGFGLGMVMPVMNIAIQNEFKQAQLGVATSSVQLFRGLGSTVGIALFGALLTAGITANLPDIENDDYLATVRQSPEASRLGSFESSDTLLTLNTPDVKQGISEGFANGIASSQLPDDAQAQAIQTFEANQQAYASKITHAFSESLSRIFVTSAVLMALASIMVFFLRERELSHHGDPVHTEG